MATTTPCYLSRCGRSNSPCLSSKKPALRYFGSFENFLIACQANAPLLYPKLPFTDFFPEFLWSDWQALVDWNADFNSELTQAVLDTVSKLQDFYSNPHIYLPFRLPNLREKAKDSELADLIDTTIAEADPPLRTLHNIIGNFFKPSAVLSALGGPNSIQNYVYGDSVPHHWAPSSPDTVEANFKALRTRVIQDISIQPQLQKHVSERRFPKKFPKIDTEDYWHSAINMPTPPVPISSFSPQPSLPSTSSASLASPLPATAALHHAYPLNTLILNKVPPSLYPLCPCCSPLKSSNNIAISMHIFKDGSSTKHLAPSSCFLRIQARLLFTPMAPSATITDCTSSCFPPFLNNFTSLCCCKVPLPPQNSLSYSSITTFLVLFLHPSFPSPNYYLNIPSSLSSLISCPLHSLTPPFTFRSVSISLLFNCPTLSLRTGPPPYLNLALISQCGHLLLSPPFQGPIHLYNMCNSGYSCIILIRKRILFPPLLMCSYISLPPGKPHPPQPFTFVSPTVSHRPNTS